MLCSWGLSVGASTRYVIKQKVSISLYIFIFPAQDLHFLPCPRFLRLPFYYLWSPENCDRVFCSCMLAIPLRARFNWTSVISDLLTRFKRRPLLRMQVKAKEFAVCMQSTSWAAIWKGCNSFHHSAGKMQSTQAPDTAMENGSEAPAGCW